MKFETKFNVDEHAWYMKDNKPTEVVISANVSKSTNNVAIGHRVRGIADGGDSVATL